MRPLASALALAVLAIGCGGAPVEPAPTSRAPAPTSTVTVTTSDGVTVFGEVYDGGLPRSAPLVLLFHQAGSSGRGEYGPLIGWLNGLGWRAVAWDQRSGGDTHGVGNRTAEALPAGTPAAFCDATPDLAAAFDWATEGGAERVVVWGSSYSAALAVRLAADRPEVAGVIAASPASGGPMADCRARDRVADVEAPVLVLRPASEMGLASAQEQREVLTAAGATFIVVEHGVHGSSMLVDARTGHDMAAAREQVAAWLRRVVG